MDLPVIVTIKLPNGRYGHAYADDMPQAGMTPPGSNSYATKELADEAGKDRSDTIGQERGMFDRFMLDQEPPPVEWQGDDEDGDEPGSGLAAELSKIVGMLTKLLKALKDDEPDEEDESE